jgi:GH15 family glucan-1,4-alpha-glucosidase
MCWVAVQRGAKLARDLGLQPQSESWSAEAARMRETILERGFNSELGFFTQGLDGKHADASNLLLPTLGLLDAKDPRFVSTVRAYERLLVRDGWMLRYVHADDFGETTSAFSICSFWWAEALALMGELDDAAALFQRLLRSANRVGLFSEDVDPKSGRLLGNFPQAYTHVGLVHAAMTIGELLEARDGRVRAWS